MTKSLEERNAQLLKELEIKRLKDAEAYQQELVYLFHIYFRHKKQFAESERIEKKEEYLEHKRRKSITQYESLKMEFKQVVNESETAN